MRYARIGPARSGTPNPGSFQRSCTILEAITGGTHTTEFEISSTTAHASSFVRMVNKTMVCWCADSGRIGLALMRSDSARIGANRSDSPGNCWAVMVEAPVWPDSHGGKRALAAWLLRIGTAQSRFAGHRGFLTGRGEAERVGPGESGRIEADPVDSLADGGSRRIMLTGRRRFAPMRANRADSLRRAKP
ncbi:hypothetical protein Taro_012621 [Colocasia esculenta]|uniref:Uncharacterized protein n=1 Tax=Colocasia esculenta TaxID=4460 RepID=A0A843UDI3_COLES|nr:hypothetical protein [Colocasia esculenta]